MEVDSIHEQHAVQVDQFAVALLQVAPQFSQIAQHLACHVRVGDVLREQRTAGDYAIIAS